MPDDAKLEKLGLKFLKQFGIQRTNLAQKADGQILTFGEKRTRGYFDQQREKQVEDEVIARGIFFNRRLDGVNFTGIGLGGGCKIMCANRAQIAQIKFVWPNLQPYEQRKVASPDDIMRLVREGHAVMTHKNLVNPAEVKKLTITSCSPLYRGAAGTQEFVYPCAQLEAIADLGGTNVPVQLYCPILTTNLIRP